MILKISLDNPKEYEERALNQAFKFINDKFDWINTINEEEAIDFLENYCIDQMQRKSEKLQSWTKIYCEKCEQELNGDK